MQYTKIAMLSLCLIVSSLTSVLSNNKILIISSYGSDYQWSNTIIDHISMKIQDTYPSVELNVEYLSSERFDGAQVWTDRMSMLLNNYSETLPLAVILVSDEAWMAYQEVKNEKFFKVPLFLSAVKPHSISVQKFEHKFETLTLNDMDSTTAVMKKFNATGIIRKMNIPQFFKLMHNSIKNISEYTIITDARFYGVYNRLMIENYLHQIGSTIPTHYYDARFVKTDSMLQKLPHIPSNAGVLMTSWLNIQSGFEYSQAHIYKQMNEALTPPIFITNNIGIASGNFIGGIFNEGNFWGEKTGEMVIQMLQGTPLSNIPVETYADEECQINWNVMHQSGMNQYHFPKETRYVNQDVSIFIKYKIWLLVGGVLLALILISMVIISKSNFKLKRAEKETLHVLNDLNSINKELIKTQTELHKEVNKSEKSNLMKSAFIANMESEIRTPLTLIVGFAELISSTNDPETLKEGTSQIVENSNILNNLISNILDISNIQSGEISLSNDEIGPEGLFKDMINLFEKKTYTNVTLSLVPSTTTKKIYNDSKRVAQILYIFMENATKFTLQGNIEAGYFDTENGWIELYVKDTGIGIKQDDQKRIFDYFYKCNSYISGAGLGLSVAQELTKALGGEIGVSSIPDKGSRFWIRLRNENHISDV